jgi:hypothetical protein
VPALQQPEDLARLAQSGPVGNRNQDEVTRGDGALGEDLKVALGVHNHETAPIRALQHVLQLKRCVSGVLEVGDVRARGDVVNPVLPHAERAGKGPLAHGRHEVPSRTLVAHGKHRVHHGLVVDVQDQDRKVFAECPQVDRKVRGECGLADAPLVARDGEDVKGPQFTPRRGEDFAPISWVAPPQKLRPAR